MIRDLVGDLVPQSNRGLVSPASSYVAQAVAASSYEHQGDTEALNISYALAMAPDRNVEKPKLVTTKRVRSTLHLDSLRLESIDDLLDDWLESKLHRQVIRSRVQGVVYRIILASFCADIIDATGSREEVSVLVERDGHYSISREECFFYSITVMAVDVNIKHSLICLQQLEDAHHAVICVAEPISLKFLRMMQPSSPVDCNFSVTLGN